MPIALDKLFEHKFSDKNAHQTEIDKILKWTPYASIFLFDLLGLKTRNRWMKHLLLVGCSEIILSAVSNALKKTTHERRPFPSIRFDSFPSGHADTAFAGAEVIRMELKDEYPVLSYSGYAVAASVSVLRLYKDKHWVSDLVGGAVLGFLCTRLVYGLFGKKKTNPVQEEERAEVHVEPDGQLKLKFKSAEKAKE